MVATLVSVRLVSDATGAGTTCRGDSKGGVSGALGETGGGKSEYCLIYQAILIRAFSAVCYAPIIGIDQYISCTFIAIVIVSSIKRNVSL